MSYEAEKIIIISIMTESDHEYAAIISFSVIESKL